MSVLDKFLNVIKLNDDEYDEEDYLDEEVEEEESAPRSRVIKKREEDTVPDLSSYESDDKDDDPEPVVAVAEHVYGQLLHQIGTVAAFPLSHRGMGHIHILQEKFTLLLLVFPVRD